MKLDMKKLMQQAQQMQTEMQKKQQELATKTYTSTVGGGMVTATVNGNHEVVSVAIDPSVIEMNDVDMLQDLVVAAVNEGMRQANEAAQAEMQGMMGGMGGLGNMFG
jgi:DNA-binding YbaB/EbfC family protein